MMYRSFQARLRLPAAAGVFLLWRLTIAPAGENSVMTAAAPSFTARNIHGAVVTSDSLLAHGPVVVDFWATWCAPCMAELRAVKRLADRGGLTVLAVSEDGPQDIEKVKQTAALKKWPFAVVVDNGKELASKFQVAAVPELFLIGADGKIHARHRGYAPGDDTRLEKEIRDLPGKK